MRKLSVLCSVVLLLAAASSVWATGDVGLLVSCQGEECNGGSTLYSYQYAVLNSGKSPVSISSFEIGTGDLAQLDYTNPFVTAPGNPAVAPSTPVLPTGWTFTVLPNSDFLGQLLYQTDGLFIPHGGTSPGPVAPAPGVIEWIDGPTDAIQLGAGESVVFGFTNPLPPKDFSWVVGTVSDGTAQTNWLDPVAGGIGVFTDGPVHAPFIPEPVTLLGMFLSIGAVGGYIRRRRMAAA